MKKGFCFLFIIFCTLLASCTTALADNTELYCTQGQMAYRDGYMYYVTQDYYMTHKLGDGRETGRPETADIWRIADVPGAQPELLGWVPLYDSDGIAQRSVVGMIPCGQWVYFIRASGVESAMKVLLSRLNIATGQVEDLDEMASNASVIRDGDRLYYFSRSLHTPAVLDLAAGDIQPWQLPVSIGAENGYMQQSISGSFSRRSIVDISGGYVYFAAQDKNSQVLQVMRVPLSGGEAETVIADITEYLDCVGFAQGDLFFFTDFQTLWCVDAASQAILDIVALRQDDEDESYRLVRCSIRDGKLYDLKADGLYVSTLGVNRDTLWIPGATEDLGNIGLGKNYIYMFQSCDYDDLTELIRVPLNASSLEEKEIIAPEMGSIDTQEEGNWVFYEYANAVTIDDYRGSETAVQVPSQIHGKPVISVRMSPNNRERPMQSLSIPEGVKRIQYICDDDMTELSLPASLLFLECRGYPYVFGIDDYATIRYAGTKAQWENLCKVSENFVGLDDRHAEHLTVICADGIWAQPDATPVPTETPAPTEASFDPNDYSAVWAHHWVRTDDPAAYLDITRNGDGTLHLAARFTPSVSFSLNFLPSDYEIIYFEAPLSAYEGDMRIDGESGMLELALFPDRLDSADPLLDYLVQNGSWFYFTTENPPDLSRYGWVPHEEYDASEDDVYVSPAEVQRLFAFLSETPLTASSGAGAWEGHLRINADGSFTGDYHDADADAIYQVSFSGNIIPSGTEKWGDTVYGLWVENLTTEKTPGTEGVDEYGDRVLYTDAPIHDRDYLRLTLPGTPDDEIPEMVRGEIGGTYWEWDDYSRFVTLSRWDDGWGFFAETEGGIDWPDSDESSMSLVQWGGIWQARSSESRLYIFREEGAPGDYQVIHTMTKNGETRAIRGALYFVDEITVDYDVPGLLYAGIVGDPYGSTLSLTPFSSLDDRMTPWIKVIEGEYEREEFLDDPVWQIDPSIRDLAEIGLGPIAAPTPTAAPNTSYKLPKNVSRLPNGNLRYDDGLIAFEAPGDALIRGNNATYNGKTGLFPENTTLTGYRVMIPSTENLSGFDGLYWEETQKRYFDAVIAGVVQLPPEVDATEFAWASYEKMKEFGYTTVAGRTAKYRVGGIIVNGLQNNTELLIPLSGNRNYIINYYEYPDAGRKNAVELFLNTLEIRDSLFAEPPAGPVQTESPAPTPAPTATPDLSAWTGHWMTYAEDMAEMIITNNGNGTLHAKALFLPAGDHEATLTPQGDGSMRFESQYGHLIGSLIRQADGGLRLTFTGGTTMEDEEATEYQGYFAQGFTYYPATYADMWYQTPEDAAATEDDWLGYWTAMNGDGVSALQISRMNGQLMVDVTLGRYHFSGPADTGSDSIMAVYDDDFCCLLLLNNKLNKIAMLEVDTSIEEVYDITGNPYYGVLIFQKTPDINTYLTPDQIDALLNAEVPPTLIMPVPTQAPQNIALLPIPGKAGCMQVPISRADATSYIVGSKDPTAYAPFRMIDGEETTSFQFSTKTAPLGQAYLYFDFDGPVTLDELWMKNGFWKITDGKDQYTRNSRVKKMTIFVRFAGSGDYQLLKDVSLKDDSARKDWKVIDMLGVQNVTGVRIRIDEIFKGSKFPTDVCISEIMFVQRAN